MALRVITEPIHEPVTLTEAKLHLRVDDTTEDTLITSLIVAARKYCETYQNRAYVQQTLELTLDDWPICGPEPIRIPRPPLISVTSVKYYDTENAEHIWDSSLYYVDIDSEPGRISPNYSEIYPTMTLRPINGVKVRYVAGYDPSITVETISVGTTPAPIAGTVINSDGSISVTVLNDDGSATVTTTDYCVNVPRTVKQAMLLLIADWYENREESILKTTSRDVDFSVKALLGLERVCPI